MGRNMGDGLKNTKRFGGEAGDALVCNELTLELL